MSDMRSNILQCAASRELTTQTHYESVKDACTKNDVDVRTSLATMYTFGEDNEHDTMLRNLTAAVKPAARCGVKTSASARFPPTDVVGAHGYNLHLTYNRLMYAPCVRLECRFVNRHRPELPPYHIIVLEFHFSLCDGKVLQRFEMSSSREQVGDAVHEYLTQVGFTTSGATSSGFANLKQHRHRFGESEQDVIRFFRSLRSAEDARVAIRIADTEAAAARKLFAISERLPGGYGPLFEALDKPQYFAFGEEINSVSLSKENRKSPGALMRSMVPFPMCRLDAVDTFSSLKQAAIHLAYSAAASDMEEQSSVELWAEARHNAVVYHLEHYDVPILAVNFDRHFSRLGNREYEAIFKLPHESLANALFEEDEGKSREAREYRTLQLVLDDVPRLPSHDAYFMVTNRGGFNWLRGIGTTVHKLDGTAISYRRVKVKPRRRQFTFHSFMETCTLLQDPTSSFVTHLLNQDTSTLEDVNITRDIDLGHVRLADAWLRDWKPWNSEQKQVVRSIHNAKGGLVIIKGVVGTGKTLLQSALSLYFAQVGYKVLVAPPSNSNASHSAIEMNVSDHEGVTMFRNATAGDHFKPRDDSGTASPVRPTPAIRRLFASALGSTVQDISEKQAQHRTNHHVGGEMSSLHSLEFSLHSIKDRKAGGRKHSVEQAVIDETEKGEFKLYTEDGIRIKEDVDAWDVFRKHLAVSRDGQIDWANQNAVEEYEESYRHCKNQIVAATDILITTTGNARCKEILEHWLLSEIKYGIPCKGVVVMCDEAFKDTELGTWNAMMAPSKKTKGVFLFGDERQLTPTNTASTGKLTYGQFNAQLSIALPFRLVKEGYPFVFLKEQQRMHLCLSKFPNEDFYGGQLRDGARVRNTLDESGPTSQPGLSEVLHKIICKSFDDDEAAKVYLENRTDEKARHHYFEIEGTRKIEKNDTSPWVKGHIDVFFEHIFPDLQHFWQDQTFKKLMIICPYTKARKEYRAAIEELQTTQKLPSSWYPDVEDVTAEALSASASGSSISSRTSPPPIAATNDDQEAEPGKCVHQVPYHRLSPRPGVIHGGHGWIFPAS